MIKSFLLLLGLSFTLAIQFGPIFDSPLKSPNVVKHKGVYYVLSADNSKDGFLTIRSSWDLRNWENETTIFSNQSAPAWKRSGSNFSDPTLQILGDNDFRLYFGTVDDSQNEYQPGVAFATNIMGPYHSLDRPLHSEDFVSSHCLLNANGDLYLIWTAAFAAALRGRRLENDGLGNADDRTYTLLDADPWAGKYLYDTFSMARNGMYYVFYTGENGIGVARSNNPMGPYDTLGKPLIAPNDEIFLTRNPSVAKFFDDSTDLLFFGGFSIPNVNEPFKFYARTMEWGADGWPYVPDQS